MSAIIEQLKTLIAEELDVNLKAEEIDENASLFEDGLGFDSIAVVEFIAAIEKHFGLQFVDSDLSLEAFSSLNAIAECIQSRQKAPALVD